MTRMAWLTCRMWTICARQGSEGDRTRHVADHARCARRRSQRTVHRFYHVPASNTADWSPDSRKHEDRFAGVRNESYTLQAPAPSARNTLMESGILMALSVCQYCRPGSASSGRSRRPQSSMASGIPRTDLAAALAQPWRRRCRFSRRRHADAREPRRSSAWRQANMCRLKFRLADSLADAEAVVAKQKETGLVAMCGHTRRFNPVTSVGAQQDQGWRTEHPADGCADLLLPSQEHQCRR